MNECHSRDALTRLSPDPDATPFPSESTLKQSADDPPHKKKKSDPARNEGSNRGGNS